MVARLVGFVGIEICFGEGLTAGHSTAHRSGRDDKSNVVGVGSKVVMLVYGLLSYPGANSGFIFRMVLVVLAPITVCTSSTRPPQVAISSAPTTVALV